LIHDVKYTFEWKSRCRAQKEFEKYLSRLPAREKGTFVFDIRHAQCEFYSARDIRARNAQREKKREKERKKRERERERERKRKRERENKKRYKNRNFA